MHILIVMTYLLSASEQTFFFFLSVVNRGRKNRGTKSRVVTDEEVPDVEAGNQTEV